MWGIYHEAIPMGFETFYRRGCLYPDSYHEAIPMGFETDTVDESETIGEIMKPSLWDLKLGSRRTIRRF